LQANRFEECVAVLQNLRSNSPADTNLLRLLYKVYAQLEDWDALERLLPALVKQKAMAVEALSSLADAVLLGQLRNAATNASELQQLWKKAKASQCETPELVTEYSKLLLHAGEAEGARRALEKALKKRWDSETVLCYGKLDSGLALKQLLTAEHWQRSRPSDAALLLTLARLALRSELWGKAREYYEATLAMQADAEAFVEYAGLMRGLGFDAEADAATRSALETAGLSSSLPTPQSV
jgi:HemY protein